jgi:hypothetical protein
VSDRGDGEPAGDLPEILGLGEQRVNRGPDRATGLFVEPDRGEGAGQRQCTGGQEHGQAAAPLLGRDGQAGDADRGDHAGDDEPSSQRVGTVDVRSHDA